MKEIRINLKNFNNVKVPIRNMKFFLEKLKIERTREKNGNNSYFLIEAPGNAGTKLNEGTEMKKSPERRGVASVLGNEIERRKY